MGFPLALKDFLTLKFCPERSEGQKILNFGFCCLNKSCSNFVHILAQKLQVLPKQKSHHTPQIIFSEKSSESPQVENFGFWTILGGRRGIRFWASIDPLGSISGEDKGGMGFPLALKNFLN